MRQILAKIVLLLTVSALALAVAPVIDAHAQTAPTRDTAMEGQFLSAVNQQRAAAGLPALTYNGGLAAAASQWAYSMANGSFLQHAGDISGGAPAGWTKVGENVGRGQTVASLTTSFMNSPSHRAAILDPDFTQIGIGVWIHPTGKVYTAHRFAAVGAAPAPAQAAAPVVTEPVATAAPVVVAAPEPTTAPVVVVAAPEPTAEPVLVAEAAPVVTADPEPVAVVVTQPTTADESFGEAPTELAFVDDAQTQSERKAAKMAIKLGAAVTGLFN